MRLLGALAALTTLAVPAPTFAQAALDPVEQARLASEGYYRYLVQSSACRWLRPTIDAVMYREKSLWLDLAALVNKPAADAIQTPMPEAQPCGSPVDQQAKGEAAQALYRWTTRSLILAQFSAQPGWTQQIVELNAAPINAVEPIRKDIEGSMGAALAKAETDTLVVEARIVLNLICEPRKADRVTVPRACPEVPAQFLAERPVALKRVEAVELLNLLLPAAIVQEQRGEIGKAYQFKSDLLDYSYECKPEIYTIYPESPDTKEVDGILDVAVHRHGFAGVVGRIKVKLAMGSYEIVDSGELVIGGFGFGSISAPRFSFCVPTSY